MSQYGGENNPHFRPRQRPDPTIPEHIQPEPMQPWDYHPTQILQSDRIQPRPRPHSQLPVNLPVHGHQEPLPPMVQQHAPYPQPPTPARHHQPTRDSRPIGHSQLVDGTPMLQPNRDSRPVDGQPGRQPYRHSHPVLVDPYPQPPTPARHHQPTRDSRPIGHSQLVDGTPMRQPNRDSRPVDGRPGRQPYRHSHPVLVDPHVPPVYQPKPKAKPKPPRESRPIRGRSEHGPPRENLMYPEPNRTKPITWCGAVFCVILWLVIILGGLLVLIIYLVYHPRTPHFEISSATLNAVYLDMGYLLNADLTVLVNFTNPNKKVNVDFSYVILQLYFEKHLIANQYIEPFSAFSAENKLASVELVSSQVRLPLPVIQKLVTQIQRNRIMFEVDGVFHARSNFGSLLRYSYWLYGHCNIEMTGPPSGITISSKCYTKG